MLPEKKSLDTSDIKVLADLLDGKASGAGYKCKCPCHDDSTNSLSISPGLHQPVIYKCFAGCDQETLGTKLRSLLGKDYVRPMSQTSAAPINTVVKASFPNKHKEPDAIYPYYDTAGTLLYRKCRYTDRNGQKAFYFEHFVNGVTHKGKGEQPTVLYCQPKLSRLRGKVPVLICEGEKDCDRLNALFGDEWTAVTNDNGGGSWSRKHAELLHGCDVYIVEDCDEPGRLRTEKIISTGKFKSLLGILSFSIDEVGEKGDVSDWLAKGHTADELRERLKALQTPKDEKQKKTEASREDYVEMFRQELGELRRDIFSGDLMYKSPQGDWEPALNEVDQLESVALELNRVSKEKSYRTSAVAKHLSYHEKHTTPQFIPDLPEWDHRDRLKEMAGVLKIRNEQLLSVDTPEQLIKEWCANVFRKLEDPSMNSSPSREFILIISSKEQKLGKDYWVRSLFCGIEPWFTDLTVCSNEKDNFDQIHDALVLNIDEFDRVAKMDSAFVKSLITKHTTKFRGAYQRKKSFKRSRCSFIASCNDFDILRDSSGNSRYCILEINGIDRQIKKSVEWSMQCLAQAKWLAEDEYIAGDRAWQEMEKYINGKTPISPVEEIAQAWEVATEKYLESIRFNDTEKFNEIKEKKFILASDATELVDRLSQSFRLTRRQIGGKLKEAEISQRGAGSRTFYYTHRFWLEDCEFKFKA